MKRLEEYYTPDVSIQTDIHELSDPWLDVEADRTDVNELVLNIVIKYLAEYFQLPPQDIEGLKVGVNAAMSPSELEAASIIANSFLAMGGDDVPADEMLASGCLSDVRSTAALFKEIAFHQSYSDRQSFISMDLGSGSGILMIASIVAARRRGIRESIHIGFDTQIKAVRDSRRALLNTVVDGNTDIIVECADVLRPELWEVYGKTPLSHWVSETISHSTPPMRFRDNGDIEMCDDLQARIDMMVNSLSDPFAGVVANTATHRESFVRDVRDGRTAMFPDLVNGRLELDRENTKLMLETCVDSEPRLLHEIGDEFDGYEDFGIKGRWFDPAEFEGLEGEMDKIFGKLAGSRSIGGRRSKGQKALTKANKKPDRNLQKNKRKNKRKERKKSRKKKK
jgi:hypothetical protein